MVMPLPDVIVTLRQAQGDTIDVMVSLSNHGALRQAQGDNLILLQEAQMVNPATFFLATHLIPLKHLKGLRYFRYVRGKETNWISLS